MSEVIEKKYRKWMVHNKHARKDIAISTIHLLSGTLRSVIAGIIDVSAIVFGL